MASGTEKLWNDEGKMLDLPTDLEKKVMELKMDDTTHVLHLEAVIKSYNHCTRLGDWTDELTFFGLINDFEASSPNSVSCSILNAWKTKQKHPLPVLFCCH